MSEVKKQVEALAETLRKAAQGWSSILIDKEPYWQHLALAALSHPAPDVPEAEEVRRVQIRTAIQDLKREARFLAVVDARDKALSLLSDVLVYLMPPELNIGDAVEEIRGRHAEQDLFFQRTNSHPPHPNAWKEAHTDRATLLRLLDAAREELAEERAARHDMAYAEGYLAGWGSESESTLESVQRMRAEAVAVLKKLTLNDRPQQTEPKP
jgi:hypothetical protein